MITDMTYSAASEPIASPEALNTPVEVTEADITRIETAYVLPVGARVVETGVADPRVTLRYTSRSGTYSIAVTLRTRDAHFLSQAGHIFVAYVSFGMLMLETGNFTSRGWVDRGYAGFLASRRDSDIAKIFGLSPDTAAQLRISQDTIRLQGRTYYKVYGPREAVVQAAYEYLLTRTIRALGRFRTYASPAHTSGQSSSRNQGATHPPTSNRSRPLLLAEALSIAVCLYQGTVKRLGGRDFIAQMLPQTRAKIAAVSGSWLPAPIHYQPKE